jgi:prepilin-type N-terminal cleavage/methylation domain-containing protein
MNKKGFTLVELTIVIALIMIIPTMAIPSISENVKTSKMLSLKSNAKTVLTELSHKKLQNQKFDETSVTETTIEDILNIPNDSYNSLNIVNSGGNMYISVIGKGKWAGLVACGTYKELVIGEGAECGGITNAALVNKN